MKKLLITLGIIIALLAIFAFVGKRQGWIGKKKLTKVSTEAAKNRTIIETVSASGKIYPKVEVKISADVSGEVVELKVEEGDSVKQGDLLARIDPEIYKSMVARAEAAVNTAKANRATSEARLSQIDVQRAQAETTLKRNEQLFKDEILSKVELENADVALQTIDADIKATGKSVEAAQFSVQSAQASLKEAKDNLRKTNIYAPTSGIISLLNIEQGERVVGTSQFSGTEIMRIADFDEMETRVDVSENDIIRVNVGDTAIVEVDAYIDRKFKGIVTQISSSSNATSQLSTDQVTNFSVKVRLLKSSYQDLLDKNKKQFPFRPGMSVSVDIQTEKKEKILTIPVQAVTVRALADSLKTGKEGEEELREVVFVYNGKQVNEQVVKVGIQDDTYMEILEGLSKGDEVVVAPYRAIAKELENDTEVEKVDKEKLYEKKK